MEVTAKTAEQLRLTADEFELIKQKLGRVPNFNELCAFSGMWSEHCSYKNSIRWLKTLPREGGRMLVKAGEENAGLMDIGDGWAVVFKIESHNHPSAIEPFQGAATGVGGIHRDIFTMGARPIAALNSLRFGNLEEDKTQHLLSGVVHGIGHYGNCFGAIAIYRVMLDAFPGRKLIILLATFLVPSFLYWTSGIHKEGLIFTGISTIVYCIYFGTKEKRLGFKRASLLVISILLILTLRNFLIVILVPAMFAWMLANRKPKYGLAIFAGLYLSFAIFFFASKYIIPQVNLPQAVVNKQQEFKQLRPGGSTIPMKDLEPNVISFIKNTPQAINLSTVRPYPSDVHHILSLAAAVEINLLLLLFLLFLFYRKKGKGNGSRNLIYFCLFFSITLLLTIGFTVNNLGAIVRYRSVIMPLLVIPMVAQIDWERIGKRIFNNIKNKDNVNNSPHISPDSQAT